MKKTKQVQKRLTVSKSSEQKYKTHEQLKQFVASQLAYSILYSLRDSKWSQYLGLERVTYTVLMDNAIVVWGNYWTILKNVGTFLLS